MLKIFMILVFFDEKLHILRSKIADLGVILSDFLVNYAVFCTIFDFCKFLTQIPIRVETLGFRVLLFNNSVATTSRCNVTSRCCAKKLTLFCDRIESISVADARTPRRGISFRV